MSSQTFNTFGFFKSLPIGAEFQVKIKTSSMSPLLKVGDSVLVKKIKFSHVKVGDIICFYQDFNNSLIIHRVVKKIQSNNNDNSTLITKGDALRMPDHEKVNKEFFIGLVVSKDVNSKKTINIHKVLFIIWQRLLFKMKLV